MLATRFCNLSTILVLMRQDVFKHSAMLSLPPAIAAACIKLVDMRISFLDDVMPEFQAITSFATTVGLLLVFRSARALDIYKEGSRGVHQMIGAWYDSASTLIAFCRTSTAPCEVVDDFKTTIVRLFSMLNMLCLVQLEDAENEHESHAWGFKAIDMEGLDANTLLHIKASVGKAEAVCQAIQCLIVDSIQTGVLNLPAPILTRSFQDLGSGMLTFHDTLRLSHSPIPITLPLVTELLLLLNVIVSPFMLASLTRGPIVAAICTFLNNFAFFILNSLADEIENPFSGDFNDIDVRTLHDELNERLIELLEYSTATAATTTSTRASSEIQSRPVSTQGRKPKTLRRSNTYSNPKFVKGSVIIDRVEDLLSNVITTSQESGSVERVSSLNTSETSSALPTQQSNTKPSRPCSTWSSQQSNMSSSAQWPQECSFPPTVPSMPSTQENSMDFLSSVPYSHEIEAFAVEASPVTQAAASGAPTSKPLGQILESPTEDDERSTPGTPVSQKRPGRGQLWI